MKDTRRYLDIHVYLSLSASSCPAEGLLRALTSSDVTWRCLRRQRYHSSWSEKTRRMLRARYMYLVVGTDKGCCSVCDGFHSPNQWHKSSTNPGVTLQPRCHCSRKYTRTTNGTRIC